MRSGGDEAAATGLGIVERTGGWYAATGLDSGDECVGPGHKVGGLLLQWDWCQQHRLQGGVGGSGLEEQGPHGEP